MKSVEKRAWVTSGLEQCWCAGQWCQEDSHCWKSRERMAGRTGNEQGPAVHLQMDAGQAGRDVGPAAWDLLLWKGY